jgi:hypothetical protein
MGWFDYDYIVTQDGTLWQRVCEPVPPNTVVGPVLLAREQRVHTLPPPQKGTHESQLDYEEAPVYNPTADGDNDTYFAEVRAYEAAATWSES